MAVILGTLTTKDGQVIPLPTAIDEVLDPKDEYRKEEERRYAKCIHKPRAYRAWDRPLACPHDVVYYGRYKVMTENLKLRGINMNDKAYNSKSYAIFEKIFENPHVWLNSRRLSEMTGVGVSSISTLIKNELNFLRAEGLLEEKDDPNSGKGKLWMFKAQCEKPKEEARLWFAKARDSRKKTGAKQAKTTLAKTGPVMPAILPPAPTRTVSIDMNTMEAIIRVPLDKLATVLSAIS